MPERSLATRRRTLRTQAGREISFTLLGFGTAPLGNFMRVLSEPACDATIAAAWECGLRYFDTAPLYGLGLAEERLGRALRQLPRADYVISTKVGRLIEPCPPGRGNGGIYRGVDDRRYVYDYSRDGVLRSLEASLARLGIDGVDILFVHDVDGPNHGGRAGSEARIRELMDRGGWQALDELRAAGVVRAIGAGVNEWQPCARLLELADPDLFLLAGRYTLLEHAPLETLFPACAHRGVGIVIGGPYNSGVLAGQETYDYARAPAAVLKHVGRLEAMCREHGVPLRQAALQFVCAHPVVTSVIPGPQTPDQTRENVRLLEAPTPPALWAELKAAGLLPDAAPTRLGDDEPC
jgi:D-threo-aldose 1-dehydrogenase